MMADTRQHLDDIKSFDVSLSFAGEDRLFVSEVAKELAHNGLLVFYDHYFKSDLLGRDLVTTLRAIYGERSRFCAVFVSASYARKRWSQQVERVAILDRASRDESPYLIPVRLDDSWIDGLPTSIAFLDGRDQLPKEVASLIADKAGPKGPPPIDKDLFQRLAIDPDTLGVFLVNFNHGADRLRVRWSGDTSRLERLHNLGKLLETYDMCTIDSNMWDADMDFSVYVSLTPKGVRFRSYIVNEFIAHRIAL